MSKYGDIVALLEWADKSKTKSEGKRWRRKDPDNTDPIEILIKAQRFADEWKKFQENQEKINKKEDKTEKKGWDKMSFVQKVTVLTVTVPLATMGYSILVLLCFKVGAEMLGYNQ
jgi:hypothetical protein